MNSLFNIVDYNCPLPEGGIFLDTSVIYEIYGQASKYTIDCYNFTGRLVANSIPMVISPRVVEELQHIILRGHKKKGQTHQEAMEEFKRIRALLDSDPNILNIGFMYDDSLNIITTEVMELYELDTADALHIVNALKIGINSFAAIDSHFQKVSNINIYAPNAPTTNDKYIEFESSNYPFLQIDGKLGSD